MKRLILIFALCGLAHATAFNITAARVNGTAAVGTAISRNGSCSAAATSCTFSGTATNSLKIVFAFHSAAATIPTLPAGWTSIASGVSGTTGGYQVACNASSSAGDTGTGTWTNATGVAGLSYAGIRSIITTANCNNMVVGVTSASNATSSTASFAAVAPVYTNNTSWMVGFLGNTASSVCNPAGMSRVTATGTVMADDTNATVSTWATTTCAVTSGTWMSFVAEIMDSNPSTCNMVGACDGWVLELDTSNSVATGGTYATGFLQTNNYSPAAAKIILTVTTPGYTSAGVATTKTRIIYGTQQLRKYYPNYTTNDELNNGTTTMTFRIALSDVIYTGDTVTYQVVSSFYTDGGGNTLNPVNAGTAVTNNSTLPLSIARTIANWSRPGFQRVSGASFNVYAVAFQRHAMNGLPVACVVFTASDAHSHFVSTTVSYPTIDNSVVSLDHGDVIEYVGNLSTSTLTQGDVITVGYRAYPWVGDETTVMDANDSTVTGSVTSGTFVANEQVKQGTTNAIAYLDNLPLSSASMVIGQVVSQTSAPDNTHTWVGQTSGAVYTPSTAPVLVNAAPSPLYSPQYYINDKSGTYGTSAAAVDPSQNVAGSVTSGVFTAGEKVTQSTSAAVAYLIGTVTGSNPMIIGATVSGTPNSTNGSTWTGGTSGAVYTQTSGPTANGNDANACAVAEGSFNYPTTPSVACATVSGGLAKMEAFNSATYSRTDASGTAYVVTSAGWNWLGAASTTTNTTGYVWATITNLAGKTSFIQNQAGNQGFGSQCANGAGLTNCGTPLHVKGISMAIITGPVSVFNLTTYLWLDQIASLVAGGTAPFYQISEVYITWCGLPSNFAGNGLKPFGGVSTAFALLRGNDFSNEGGVNMYYTALANTNTTTAATVGFINEGSGPPASNQPIFAFNTLYRTTPPVSQAVFSTNTSTAPILGSAVVQNIVENVNANETQACIAESADSSTSTPINNVMYWHNVNVGCRINRAYNDGNVNAALPIFRKAWSERYDIRDQEAIKADIFGTTNANRTGNWAMLYGVGRVGAVNVNAFGGTTGWAGAQTFLLEFPGPYSYQPGSCSENVGSGVLCNTNTINSGNGYFLFYKNRNAYDGTNPGTGNGDYRLLSNSPAVNIVPGSFSALPYDIAGQLRNLSGYGSPGPYEQQILLTQVFGW